MKKLFTLFLALVACAGTMFASDNSVDGIWYNFDDEHLTAKVTYQGAAYDSYWDEYSGEVVIPTSVTYNAKTYSVTSIGYRAFNYCTSLTSVTIPNSVTSIGNYAFSECTGLTSVTIPNSVTSIGDGAFYGCSGLTSVTIPNSVTSIGYMAFYFCSGLTSVTIPNSVTSIGKSAFYGCTGLTSVTIPNSVTSIGNSAFYWCTGLTSVTNYATTPQSINSFVFGNVDKSTCVLNVPKESVSLYQAAEGWKEFTNIVGVDVPGEDTSVDGIWYNFDDEHLTAEVTYQGDKYDSYSNEYTGEVVIPTSVTYNAQTYTVTSIGEYAFAGCSGLTSVTIPNSVTVIGEWAFTWCSGLTSVTIPNSVTSIGEVAFAGCSGLTSVTIPNSVTSIGSSAFWGCSGLTSIEIPNSVTSIGDYAFYGCTGLTSVTIPNSVTSIGGYAFFSCSSLTSVTIPNSVTSIGEYAFEFCSGLTSLSVEAGNTVYDSRNNCNAIIETSTNTLISGCQNTTIPNSVTSIGEYAFAGCSGLTSVTIPNSVTSIGNYAFYRCTGLTSVTIPNSVTSIGGGAFASCTGLTSVTNYATTPQSINSNVFENVGRSTCVLNVPKESVSLYQAAEVWKEFTNIVGVDVPGEDPEEPIETVEGDYTINYVDKDSQDLYNHVVTLYVPVAPTITGFTFVGWQTVSTMLTDGITLQAVYQADVPSSAPAVYTNPANPAQKLIKNGNVYILTEDKTYTITGQAVK